MSEHCELAVIGAGPAGIEAALAGARAGLSTVLIDQAPAAGGQYYHRSPGAFATPHPTAVEREGQALADQLGPAGVRRIVNALVWGLFKEEDGDGWLITASIAGNNASGTPLKVHAARVVLATGAYDTPLPFPGWTLPGVLTCGAALQLLKSQRVAPFKRVLVSGTGPLLLSVAAHLIDAGVKVVRVCEANRTPLGAVAHAPTLVREWHRLSEGLRYGLSLARGGTPYTQGWSVVAAEGLERVERATIAKLAADGAPIAGTRQTVDVDAVICGYGFTPNTGLARMAGCGFAYDRAARAWLPQRDPHLRSDLPGLYLAGDGAWVAGVGHSRLEGIVAGVTAAFDAGKIDAAGLEALLAPVRPRLAHQRRFGLFLQTHFSPPPGLATLAEADTLLCRCEEVSQAEVRAAVTDGARTLGEVKMLTRTGMGNCQGRMCERGVTAAICRANHSDAAEVGLYAVRPPLVPLTVDFLIRAGED